MRTSALLLALTSVACGELDAGTEISELAVDNGRSINGRSINGRSINGPDLGEELVWVSHDGVKLGGSTLEASWLEGSELVGRNGNGSIVRGWDFHQAELAARSDAGYDIKLRIRDIAPPPAGSDHWRYYIEYQETDGHWVPTCLDAGQSSPSTAVAGYWDLASGAKVSDSSRLTFACPASGAVGKCVGLGYLPWQVDTHHHSCVRAIRADYCGDGTSYTTAGKVINIYDDLGIQLDTEDWRIEAEWDGAGARCFSNNNRSLDHLPCFRARASNACGKLENFDSGTLLMTEMPD